MTAQDFLPISNPVDEVLPVDDRWRRECLKRLDDMGKTQRQLAAHIGCAQSNVSQTLTLKKTQKGSAFAHRISMALGVELPLPARALVATTLAERTNPGALKSLIEAIEKLKS